jgi:DNA repair protein RecO (recombination protein O)
VFTLLANHLALLCEDVRHAAATTSLAFRMKLLLAAGIVPHLGSCAACGEREHLHAFSPASGGVVCSACEATGFPLDEEAYAFLVAALGTRLADAPQATARALGQAERAICETAEFHANVRLRPVGRGSAVSVEARSRSAAG